MKCNDEVTGVPATHRQGEGREQSFEAGEFAAVRNELYRHPQWQDCADAVADYLKNLEWIEWGLSLCGTPADTQDTGAGG